MPQHLPQHVAIIMDGNGRWAKLRGLKREEGHRAGVERSDDIITAARRLGIRYLTLYAFSRENWARPVDEVKSLMALLKEFLVSKRQKMLDEGIALNAIGNLELLPPDVRIVLDQTRKDTSAGKDMTLTLALSYGSRDEMLRALAKLAPQIIASGKLPEAFSEKDFAGYLDTAGLPDPDLIIRTSGEIRTSNFLLWQSAYAEYVFEPCLWPDFTPEHLQQALDEFAGRSRRFGGLED